MKRDIVKALIASLNDPNAGWEYDKYTATNDRIECEIWLANGPDQMEVKFWGDKIGGKKKYEGACFIGCLMPWRWRLWWVATGKQEKAVYVPPITDSTIIAAIRSASQVPA